MADVIDLKKRQSKKQRIDKGRNRRKAEAVASMLSCGVCPRRCAHCGMAIEHFSPPPLDALYPFCEVCQDEYEAYRRRENGDDCREAFWHTDEWADCWRTWLAQMRASEAFRGSAVFLRLMEEHLD